MRSQYPKVKGRKYFKKFRVGQLYPNAVDSLNKIKTENLPLAVVPLEITDEAL